MPDFEGPGKNAWLGEAEDLREHDLRHIGVFQQMLRYIQPCFGSQLAEGDPMSIQLALQLFGVQPEHRREARLRALFDLDLVANQELHSCAEINLTRLILFDFCNLPG